MRNTCHNSWMLDKHLKQYVEVHFKKGHGEPVTGYLIQKGCEYLVEGNGYAYTFAKSYVKKVEVLK